jgi:LPS sulfotransferase NodH
MRVEEIFNVLSEVPLLKKLVDRGRLLFVGDRETIEYLESFFEKNNTTSNYDYFYWHEDAACLPCDRDILLEYNAIIIASIVDEHKIFDWLKKELEKANLNISVLKLFSDIFVNVKSERELLQESDRELASPKIAYAIASTPRSGSTAICDALTATEIAGFPKEHLRPPSQVLAEKCHFDYVRYLQILMNHKITKNGVFGTKFIAHFFQPHYQTNFDLSDIIKQFKFIYLIRRDKLAQATSVLVASRTQTWHVKSNQAYKAYQSKLANLDTIEIKDSDIDKLHERYQMLLKQEHYWENFFEQNKISPLVIEYEQFLAYPEQQLNAILKYLNIVEKDSIKILNKYQYQLHKMTKKLNIFDDNKTIKIKVGTKKLQSSFSKALMQKYHEKYGVTPI